jgi:hypothetical protein
MLHGCEEWGRLLLQLRPVMLHGDLLRLWHELLRQWHHHRMLRLGYGVLQGCVE